MSKIDELIRLYCPEGVNFEQIGKVLSRSKGTKITAGQMKEIHNLNGQVKIFAGGKTFAMVNFGDIPEKDVNYSPSIVVKSRGVIEFEYYDKPFSHKNEFWSYQSKDEKISIKFVYYYLRLNQNYFQKIANKMQMPQISLPDTEKYKIPIPPLQIQEEIVNILDKFTSLTSELEVELEARRIQYAYYRDKLLCFEGKEVEWKTLSELGKIQRGAAITKKETMMGKYPVVANAPVPISFHNKSNRKGECVVVARSGANAGLITYWNDEFFLTDAFSIHPNNELLRTKFIYYFFKNLQKEIHSMKKGAGVPHVRASDFESYLIPVPSLEEQDRIVTILDKFDALINDVSIGLPAEIKARKQQYEYYRDKLLTFN